MVVSLFVCFQLLCPFGLAMPKSQCVGIAVQVVRTQCSQWKVWAALCVAEQPGGCGGECSLFWLCFWQQLSKLLVYVYVLA